MSWNVGTFDLMASDLALCVLSDMKLWLKIQRESISLDFEKSIPINLREYVKDLVWTS